MTDDGNPRPLAAVRAKGLKGTLRVPGDKSISHRALIFGALSIGETRIAGLLEGDDVLATAEVLRALGADIARAGEGEWRVRGVGVGGFAEPETVLDHGNSGTGARLMMGAVATTPIACTFTGDASLCRRPMARVLTPLALFGAKAVGRTGARLPLTLLGAEDPGPVTYRLPVASAQVKSAVLLAGLNAPGETSVLEAAPTRDHTERMLRHFGAELSLGRDGDLTAIALRGRPELRAADIRVPADPSSAAFLVVAALLVPDSDVTLEGVLLNETRAGLYRTLREMGGDIAILNEREEGGEPIADLRVRSSRLRGVPVPAERAPSMIDEYPVLAVAAACAEGETIMAGLEELRVKESDRLGAIAAGLHACGARVAVEGDTLRVTGSGPAGPRGGATVATHMDHRIAMSFLVLGFVTGEPVAVDDTRMIATSFPGFTAALDGLGARFAETGRAP
ncbi:MAG: 3-phosphoshikimate 1-carboxyvinyltransferase [Alphaproteobacteria bacterium]|nr:3-phosphoshikimate 1-carboxyvinyltransferase [Alphaproteobacteria bacterium]